MIPNDEKVRERVIALLGTKIKFPVTRSIILQNTSNLKKDKLKVSLDKINEKLNQKLKVNDYIKYNKLNFTPFLYIILQIKIYNNTFRLILKEDIVILDKIIHLVEYLVEYFYNIQ